MEPDRFEKLTAVEAESLRLWLRHGNVMGVAWDCGISADAAYKRIGRAREKLGARSNFEAAQMLLAHDREGDVQSLDVQLSTLSGSRASAIVEVPGERGGGSADPQPPVVREQPSRFDVAAPLPPTRPAERKHNDLTWWQLLLKVIAIAAAGALGTFIILAVIFAAIDLLGRVHDETGVRDRAGSARIHRSTEGPGMKQSELRAVPTESTDRGPDLRIAETVRKRLLTSEASYDTAAADLAELNASMLRARLELNIPFHGTHEALVGATRAFAAMIEHRPLIGVVHSELDRVRELAHIPEVDDGGGPPKPPWRPLASAWLRRQAEAMKRWRSVGA